ncbi:pseudouridine synthase [Blattabacterium cuenoti]|uniref:pseudouridine synthase n=1 Tax=Blattabacterium cuenoti TaxID=1653831 RepID=UPI00163BE542|nr:pseudouridine synthase [Blattabacterium cuenoti]
MYQKIRLNHYLSNAGICSRRKADKLIQSGSIEINGVTVLKLGSLVGIDDIVKYNGKTVKNNNDKIYVLLNKPKNFICSTKDQFHRKTVIDLFPKLYEYKRIYPVGRLDYSTTGILLLTNDGFLSERLTHPKFHVKKIYHVYLNKEICNKDLDKIREGKIYLKEGRVKVLFVEKSFQKNQVKIGLSIGWNRIIKRIFKRLNYRVDHLDRINFAGFHKKNIKIGKYRFLNQEIIKKTIENNFIYEKKYKYN